MEKVKIHKPQNNNDLKSLKDIMADTLYDKMCLQKRSDFDSKCMEIFKTLPAFEQNEIKKEAETHDVELQRFISVNLLRKLLKTKDLI